MITFGSDSLRTKRFVRPRRLPVLAVLAVLLPLSCRTLPDPTTLPPVPHIASETDEVDGSEDAPERVSVDPPLALEPTPESPSPEVSRIVERPTSILVRVGLLTDQERVDFSCCDTLRVLADGKTLAESASLSVSADPAEATAPVFHLQVAALRDERQAEGMVATLERLTAIGGETVLDAESGLHKVRVGPFLLRSEADDTKRVLASHGVEGAWVVSGGGVLRDPAIEVRTGRRTLRVPGRWLAIEAPAERGVRVGRTRYRGKILLFLNDRGSLNVIDELTIEEYLRGVVPKELGPDLYPQLEALKAQTVAARTYTVRNLGEFSEEGFDICATPRCQVYGGMEVEHPLTDRAIAETADEVLLWENQPIDALYSATCGGHTEDVGTVFPLKFDEVYLKGVPCLEHGRTSLQGRRPPSGFPGALVDEQLSILGTAPEALAARLRGLRQLAGHDLRVPDQPLADRSRAAITSYWQSLGGSGAELPFEKPDQVTEDSESDFLWTLANRVGALELVAGTFAARQGDRLRVRRSFGEDQEFVWTDRTVVARRHDGVLAAGDLTVAPGDALELVHRGGVLLAVVQEIARPRITFDRVSKWARWQRFRSDRQLRLSVRERIPDFEYSSFEALEHGVSGRVGKLRLTGTDGREEIVEGLAVRWTLDLPDTKFTARRSHPKGKEAGWLFSGGGWGHGVGMCQIGAYGMAQRGNGYLGILSHYYSGVSLGRVSAVLRNVRQES